jgi:hypothetical protein
MISRLKKKDPDIASSASPFSYETFATTAIPDVYGKLKNGSSFLR